MQPLDWVARQECSPWQGQLAAETWRGRDNRETHQHHEGKSTDGVDVAVASLFTEIENSSPDRRSGWHHFSQFDTWVTRLRNLSRT